MDRFDELTEEFVETLVHMCEIFEDHTLPPLPEWVEEAIAEMGVRR